MYDYLYICTCLHRVSETVTENAIFQNFIYIRITLALAVLFITKFLRIYHRCFSAYILLSLILNTRGMSLSK